MPGSFSGPPPSAAYYDYLIQRDQFRRLTIAPQEPLLPPQRSNSTTTLPVYPANSNPNSNTMSVPSDAPPSYDVAVTSPSTSSRLEVPGSTKNDIPAAARRSMEDEVRPLPPGWVRQWDSRERHQFFVDTAADPPRSIWHHPYDDEQFLKTLSSEERERIQEQGEQERDRKDPRGPGAEYDSSTASAAPRPSIPQRASSAGLPESQKDTKGLKSFGRRFKDKVTSSTHEEREQQRAQRAEEERQYYEAHQAFRRAMDEAMRTGQPVKFARDKDGKDVYVEPPTAGPYGPGSSFGAGGYPGARSSYGEGAYGVNPYSSGPYSNPNARFIRPSVPYGGRPGYGGYGYGGYGGGYGYGGYGGGYGGRGGGLGLPIAGGLMGGLLLGGLLF